MSQHYSDPRRESEPHALPDLEVFYVNAAEAEDELNGSLPFRDDGEPNAAGWYWWSCLPGCLPDSDPVGPFETEELALADARESAGLCPHGTADDEVCEECEPQELWALQAPNGSFLTYTLSPSLSYRAPVSCWTTEQAAKDRATTLGLSDFKPFRLPDHDARRWGRSEKDGAE